MDGSNKNKYVVVTKKRVFILIETSISLVGYGVLVVYYSRRPGYLTATFLQNTPLYCYTGYLQ